MTGLLFRITFGNWKDILLHWDWVVAVVIGIVLAIVPDQNVIQAVYIPLIIAQIAASGAVLGFTLTAMSIMSATMDDDLVVYFDTIGNGIIDDLWPFWYTALLSVLSVIMGFLAVAVFSGCGLLVMRAALGVESVLVSYAVINALLIISYLAGHARDRARYLRRSNR